MSDPYGPPPVIPPEFQQYNSYVTDPHWQRIFTAIWTSCLGLCVVFSLPRVVRAVRQGTAIYSPKNWFGIREHPEDKYNALSSPAAPATERVQIPVRRSGLPTHIEGGLLKLSSLFSWTLPVIGLTIGNLIILAIYLAAFLACVLKDANLVENSNRAGFLALAQLPIIMLFGSKNSIVSLLLGPGRGYEKLNYIHRWSGRIMFLGTIIHGSLWIRNNLHYNLPILGETKEVTGIKAFAVLALIAITSLKTVRNFCYEIFLNLHYVLVIAFFISICCHTPYAAPWVFPALSIYGLDVALRLCRYRIKDANLIPVGSQMTLVHVPHTTSGWTAGQHIRFRVFFSGRVFESHPFTIFSAPPAVTCISTTPPGLWLGVRASGDWSKALNFYANEVSHFHQPRNLITINDRTNLDPGVDVAIGMQALATKTHIPTEVPVIVMIDGPYGGSGVDLGDCEAALLIAGGSGVMFTLGLLDDIVGRCVRQGRPKGERTRNVEFIWCVKCYAQISWVAAALCDIATTAYSSSTLTPALEINITIFVTGGGDPEDLPTIPNCEIVSGPRPSMSGFLKNLFRPSINRTTASGDESYEDSDSDALFAFRSIHGAEEARVPTKVPSIGLGGGTAVCTSGPASLTTDVANVVAKIRSSTGAKVGPIALHTEVLSL